MTAFDALLLVSFGGPEGPADVLPFLENVTRGRGVPPERLQQVAEHYLKFDGVSPINRQNRALLAALRDELASRELDMPVYWGNRNWSPMLTDTVQQMTDDGVTSALAIFTSAYSSYSGCRQYRENLAAARLAVGDGAPALERVGPFFNHAGFIEPFVDSTIAALTEIPESLRTNARLVFTTHSIPESMAESSGVPGGAYVRQHAEVAALVAAGVQASTSHTYQWDLVYQSRSGPPSIPWLGPDIEDHLESVSVDGAAAVVVIPIGFVSDHMEVVWDLDTQAAARANELGLVWARAATPGTDSRFVSMLADLVVERLSDVACEDRPRVGSAGASPDRCVVGCCPNPRSALPAIGGED